MKRQSFVWRRRKQQVNLVGQSKETANGSIPFRWLENCTIWRAWARGFKANFEQVDWVWSAEFQSTRCSFATAISYLFDT